MNCPSMFKDLRCGLPLGHSGRHCDRHDISGVYWTDEQATNKPELNRLDPRERYHRDPTFHALVDMIYHQLDQGTYTPTELREACMLAACMWEYRNIRPYHVIKNIGTPGGQEFWDVAAEVNRWPAWMRGMAADKGKKNG